MCIRDSIGQRDALSPLDLQSVNIMYQTDLMLTEAVTADASGTSIEFTVNNIGENGANTISLTLPQSQANGMSSFTGTGWNCRNEAQQVNCALDTLADGAESSVVLEMNAGAVNEANLGAVVSSCLLYTSPSPRDATLSRMPSSA